MLDVETGKLVALVQVGREPRQIVITPDNEYALVLNEKSGDMAVIRIFSLGGNQVGGDRVKRYKSAPLFTMIPVGERPVSAACALSERTYLYDSAWAPVAGVRLRPQRFFVSTVGRHTVFDRSSRARLGLLEGGRHAAIAVVRGPLKFPAVVLIGDEISRLIAANIDVGEGMGHW